MTRARILIVLALAAMTFLMLVAPASADPVQTIYDKFLGCDGVVSFPCPGPAL